MERNSATLSLHFSVLKQFHLMLLYLLQMFYVVSGGVFAAQHIFIFDNLCKDRKSER